MRALGNEYVEWLRARNYSADTVTSTVSAIRYFLEWCAERSVEEVAEVTRTVLESYQRSLYYQRKKNGEALAFRTQAGRLRFLKGWFRWLVRCCIIRRLS